MSRSTRLVAVLVGLAAGAALLSLLRPSPVPVSVAEVARGPFVESVEDEGRTQLREPFSVAAPIDGYLRRVALEPGDAVAAGEVLFELEPLPVPALDVRSRGQLDEDLAGARARVAATEAQLQARRTELELARLEEARSEPLHRRALISSEERDRRRAEREAAEAALQGAEHLVEVARFELAALRWIGEAAAGARAPADAPVLAVRAPAAGVVTRRHRQSEGPVAAGTAVLELGDLGELEVVVDLLSMDAVRVRPGMRVVLTRWGGGAALEGRVRRVEPAGYETVSALGVEEQRVTVRVEVLTPREAWRALGDGYRVEASFVLWEGADVLQVPTGALYRAGEGWAVFVVAGGRVRERVVTLGRQAGLAAEIRAGLQAGERVVVHPGDRLRDGLRVVFEGGASP
jgi:HlyD family secretion protein